MATIGQLLTAPEAGWKRYDDTDPSFKYIGIYAIVSNNDRFKGSSRYSLNKAARIKFDFIGTKLRIVHTLGDDRVNTVVKIDGVAEVYNAKSETILGGQYLVYEKTGLTRSRHTVEIYHSNDAVEGVNPLVFDAIDIDDTGRILHPDEVTDIRSLAINKRIRCHYTASSNTFGIFSGLGKETSHFIPLTSSTTPNGDFYFICVDKDYLGRLILVSDRNIQSGISWDALNTAGVASGSGKPLMYNPTSSLVAWYTFDANASTLANNVDGTNGTIIGTTVVDGFKGKARQFNGVNDYIVVPGQKVIPAGKKSIRFKIKVPRKPSDYGMILGNGFSTSEHGTRVQVNANGDINVVMTYGTSSNSFSLTATGYNVCDGQWHDVFITWDGTTSADSYKIYIDDMTVPKKTGNPTFTQTVNGSRNFTIGRRADANDRFFFGVIDEIEIYNDVVDPLNTTPYLDGYVISLRLPTGGIDSTDTDNEWDKYVVNSTLNGTITAGDDTVWNWSGLYTLCSTTSGASGQRTIRGNSSVAAFSSTATSQGASFRPVLVIEDLHLKKYLIMDGTDIKTYIQGVWETIGIAPPTNEMFNEKGMTDLSACTPYLMDLTNKSSLKILISNPQQQKLTSVKLTGVPTPRIVKMNEDMSFAHTSKIHSLKLSGLPDGEVRVAVSTDSGKTWQSKPEDEAWTALAVDNLTEWKEKGMRMSEFNNIRDWDEIIDATRKLRFAFYLEQSSATDEAGLSSLSMEADLQGSWDMALPGVEYKYGYSGNTNLRVLLLSDGDYKINIGSGGSSLITEVDGGVF